VSRIRYTDSLEGITAEQLAGLHVGWRIPPSPPTHLKSLRNMNAIMLAIDEAQLVGMTKMNMDLQDGGPRAARAGPN
jgi:hypothetical protein